MRSPSVRRPVLAAAALAAAALLPATHAEATGFALGRHSVVRPITITRPGSYVLRRNISHGREGAAIVIAADGVTLDLDGHALSGAGREGSIGILVNGASGVRILDGGVSHFQFGVEVRDSRNVWVEGLQIAGSDAGGPPPGEVGVHVLNSRGVTVTGNSITGTFLGIFVRGGGSGGNRITANTLTGGQNGQLGICYNPDGSGSAAGPSGDLVYGNLVSRWSLGIQTSAGTAGNIIRENDIAYFGQAIQEVAAGSNVFAENSSIQLAP